MTTEQGTPTRVDPDPGLTSSGRSVHVERARKLLFGGLVGGLGAAVVSMVIFGILDGSRGAVSAALAATMVLFFYVVGQVVMVMFADAGARTLLAVAMASYTGRVFVLGLLLLSYQSNQDALPDLVPMAVFLTTVAVVAGWLLVEVIVFRRLRIEVFDRPYVAPVQQEGEQ